MDSAAASCAALLRGMPAETAALLAWPLAAGALVAAHTRAEHLRAGTLAVTVLDEAWTPAIERMRPDLLRALSAWLPPGSLRGLALEPRSKA